MAGEASAIAIPALRPKRPASSNTPVLTRAQTTTSWALTRPRRTAATASSPAAGSPRTTVGPAGVLSTYINCPVDDDVTLHEPEDRRVIGVRDKRHGNVGGDIDGRVLVDTIRVVRHVDNSVCCWAKGQVAAITASVNLRQAGDWEQQEDE